MRFWLAEGIVRGKWKNESGFINLEFLRAKSGHKGSRNGLNNINDKKVQVILET
jgi:hypothetical protein